MITMNDMVEWGFYSFAYAKAQLLGFNVREQWAKLTILGGA
jgi:hypothetical protein